MAKKKTQTEVRTKSRHPVVFEVNARLLVHRLSARSEDPVTLGTIPDALLDEWASLGCDAIWMMGVWSTGPIGIEIARAHPDLQEEYRKALPDLTPDDVGGSPYAVSDYSVPRTLGGWNGLRTLRTRLARRGLKLILDFVPNHTARDHRWVSEHPEYYIRAGEEIPDGFFRAETLRGPAVIAHGKDPAFPGWTDTAQLNYFDDGLRAAMLAQLKEIAKRCDGVRCDMAMLVLNDVFLRTWGWLLPELDRVSPREQFWTEAVREVRKEFPDFLFIGEVYWDREWDLQQLGFDYTYDKRLYDRMRHEGALSVRDHLRADLAYQQGSLRFIENHDEVRAARAFPSEAWHFAAAVVTCSIPGGVLLHDGQLDGLTVKPPVQLIRRQEEPGSPATRSFYERLLVCVAHPVLREGEWRLLDVRPAWHDNPTAQNFLAYWWHLDGVGDRCIIVNYAPHSGQCYVEIPAADPQPSSLEFKDLMGDAVYVRDTAGLQSRGMFFELTSYGFHFFDVTAVRR
jgi:hypothetical protein